MSSVLKRTHRESPVFQACEAAKAALQSSEPDKMTDQPLLEELLACRDLDCFAGGRLPAVVCKVIRAVL